MKAGVVVVGGGVMGASIAWHAARFADPLSGPVVLLERTRLAAGSSGRSGAILRQFYSDRVVAAMARDSLRVYAGLGRATGRSIGFQRTGVVTIAPPGRPEEAALVERNVTMMSSIGIDVRRVDAAGIRRLVQGAVVAEGSTGAFEPDAGAVDPVRTVEVLAILARELGAVTRVGVEARALVVEEGRVRGVDTSAGRLHAERVVVAAGPWTRRFLRPAGLELPLRVVRPEQLFLAAPAARGATDAAAEEEDPAAGIDPRLGGEDPSLAPAAHPVLLDLEQGIYARCEGHVSREGLPVPRTRIGRMDHAQDAEVEDPDEAEPGVSPAYRRWARERLARRLPDYRARPEVGAFTGLYTLSPDEQALIGPAPGIAGLWIVAGFSGHGFKLAPSVGEGVAQMLRGEPVSAFDGAFFSPARFAEGGRSGEGAGPAPRRGFGL